ncbi:EAL domain-containing protein [Deferribacter autotrophicus]|uniref:EAL domain-containing protein n=1 Tax=Deferribacter autotrophicus TaxID=500465 RepID=A0A5A8F612_9BACT|nr:EAL domain-containing protein [Deferribacter autotrophicus]KAA0259526.1 EAL domain-containing protein [Deferribacter autotrophicus]
MINLLNSEITYLLLKLIDSTDDLVFIKKREKDDKFRIIFVNRAFTNFFELKDEEIIGKTNFEFLPYDIARMCEISDKNAWKKGTFNHSLEKAIKGNKTHYLHVIKIPIKNKMGEVIAIVGHARDVTKLVKAKENLQILNKKLIFMAECDQLTGLYNRMKFKNEIKNRIKEGTPFSIAVIDLDNFMRINQSYGFDAGDNVLKVIAKELENEFSDQILGKTGGDEFAILFDGINDKEIILKEAYKIKTKLENMEIPIYNANITYSPSATVAVFCYNNEFKIDYQELLSNLKLTIIRGKEVGKGNIVVFDERLDSKERVKKLIKEENILMTAIKHKRIVSFFHPILCTKTGQIVAYEALARIKIGKEYISIGQFLNTAITSGLITKIDSLMLDYLNENHDRLRDLNIFINLSYKSFLNKDIIVKLKNSKVNLTLEITEQIAVENLHLLQEIHSKINRNYVVDDFGIGYSSLKTVIDMVSKGLISYLKIDGSLITDIDKNNEKRNVIDAIITIARKLGLKTIAEFIEDKKTFEILQELGVDYVQGFYFSKPLHIEELKVQLFEQVEKS